MTDPAQLGGADKLADHRRLAQASHRHHPNGAHTAHACRWRDRVHGIHRADVGDVGAGGGQQTTTGYTEDVGHG